MIRFPTRLLLLAGSAAALAAGAHAQTRSLGAHVHGISDFSAAADDTGALVAELSGPAWNVAGTGDLGASADAAAEGLVSAAAGCVLQGVEIEGEMGAYEGEHAHEGHTEEAHMHGDHEHAAHSHDDHADHADHGEGGEGSGHSDVTLTWSFACAEPGGIAALDLQAVFAAFPRLESVDATFFDGERSAAGELTAERTVLRIP